MKFLVKIILVSVLLMPNFLIQKARASSPTLDEFIRIFADQGFQSFHCVELLTSMDLIYSFPRAEERGHRHSIFFIKEYQQDNTNILSFKRLHKQVLWFRFFRPERSDELQLSGYLLRNYKKSYLPFFSNWNITLEKSGSRGMLAFDYPFFPLLNSLHDSNNFETDAQIPPLFDTPS